MIQSCRRWAGYSARYQPQAVLLRRLARRPDLLPFKMSSVEERRQGTIHTAACMVIGDEVLNGKTQDTNSAYFARFCFTLGLDLRRIEVIPDEEADIVEVVRRLSERYDVVVTSGGIGPTHDDITYASIAKAFGLKLRLHGETMSLMRALSIPHPSQKEFSWDTPSAALTAKLRMAELPYDEERPQNNEVLFLAEDLWVPISVVNGNVYILPGVPRLFTKLIDSLKKVWLPRLTDPDGKGISRVMISTPLAESQVASYLTDLASRVEPRGVKVGSYPRWGRRNNTVTLVGRDRAFIDSLVAEVEKGVEGIRISEEGEDDSSSEDKPKQPASR